MWNLVVELEENIWEDIGIRRLLDSKLQIAKITSPMSDKHIIIYILIFFWDLAENFTQHNLKCRRVWIDSGLEELSFVYDINRLYLEWFRSKL
jgi:hypothetical protein